MNRTPLLKHPFALKSMFVGLLVALSMLPAAAQREMQSMGQGEGQEIEMATGLRADGMIWVVVGVVLIVLFGLLIYLWRLERRIDRLERESP
jgi:hypothetical protein